MAQELKVISDFYDFMLWMIKHTEKFPRHHRYSLGLTIENRMQVLLTAKYAREKVAFLQQANLELEVLRFQVRLAKDLRALSVDSHGHAAKLIAAVGRQIGGWIKSKAGTRDEATPAALGEGDRLPEPGPGGAQGAAGKRDRHSVQAFSFPLEPQLLRLSRELSGARAPPEFRAAAEFAL
jgi:hypothetical protein